MFKIQASFEMARVGSVKEGAGPHVGMVAPFEEHVLLVHISAVGHVPESLPVHPVSLIDVLRREGVAFRFVKFERDAYAAASGEYDTLPVSLADYVKYAV